MRARETGPPAGPVGPVVPVTPVGPVAGWLAPPPTDTGALGPVAPSGPVGPVGPGWTATVVPPSGAVASGVAAAGFG
jgi:hypothetical protein